MLDTLRRAHFHQRFRLGGAAFVASLFGKPDNWSLSQLADPAREEEFGPRLGQVLYSLRVGKALAPSPVKFTDRLAEPRYLTTKVKAGAYVLYRNPQAPADGVPLEAGEAFVISPSNCPTTVMVSDEGTVALHTGRDCLVDRHRLLHGFRGPARTNESICHTALRRLGDGRGVRVKVLWGVAGCFFVHDRDNPQHGAFNTVLREMICKRWGEECAPLYGTKFHLDLPKLIRAQCIEWGVPDEHIDLVHAYQDPEGTWRDGTPGAPRNLVVLARYS